MRNCSSYGRYKDQQDFVFALKELVVWKEKNTHFRFFQYNMASVLKATFTFSKSRTKVLNRKRDEVFIFFKDNVPVKMFVDWLEDLVVKRALQILKQEQMREGWD